mmetsp:Transcript_19694/g.36203  ORF Transcript_19694/g.36203 Transcript_19694/m.36203 type:complete len:290 (+) Transcript_19694:98-967(+)|eukprot:CAMPEP_0201885180 /NCGR_PEP_ID=MMETSP0902-20130614/18245_1 /ASSEMBLY_ACC=CAM_ASM_000551 /TAXON_ID=420261 /ORGANISM="Thalassiosira antarctica, Strain CCMP982" /LENGTH=289 /DNA_ID=CAMNT_0048414283 /DNA_START=48 /DNA_END=917 /DNA_ORIENTATION=+
MTPRLLVTTVICSALAHSAAAFGFPELSINDGSTMSGDRRRFLQATAAISVASWTGGKSSTPWLSPASAADVATDSSTAAVEVPMKRFVDTANPSLFVIEIPQRFFTIRRSAKGDLPDPKTGQGRRGGTIFSSGDMSKAEVIGVERFPVRNFLEEEGYAPTGDLSTFTSIGDPTAIAELLLRRREKDKPGTQGPAKLNRESVALSSDGTTLTFSLKQEINVQKPELLLEQEGISELFRTTLAKATLASNDGQMMAVFASALDQDYAGPDGVALQKAVDSFTATDQSAKK